ncbi:MAG: hypothetical protein KIG65_03170 [Eubacteriales bacterium]|nr:hypothetical protein [Eubacteriales bacterium]
MLIFILVFALSVLLRVQKNQNLPGDTVNVSQIKDLVSVDEKMDFKAIEDIVRIYEEHGYTGGSIHDFD